MRKSRLNIARIMILVLFVGKEAIPCMGFSASSPPKLEVQRYQLLGGFKDCRVAGRNNRVVSFAESTGTDSGFSIRRKSIVRAYNLQTAMFLFLCLVLVWIPDKTKTTMMATKLGGAAGFGLAGGVSNILANATTHDNLGSDTYKRLNVGLLIFSLVGLASVPGDAAFHPRFLPALIICAALGLTRLLGCAVSYRGWRLGVGSDGNTVGPKRMLREFIDGTKATFSGLRLDNMKGKMYRNLLVLVLLGMFSNAAQVFFLMDMGEPFFDISLQWSAVSRLFLISTMIFSLKSAAERDRLTGKTFIQLNFLISAWAFFVAIGRGTYMGGFSVRRWSDLGIFALPFFWEGVKSLREEKPDNP